MKKKSIEIDKPQTTSVEDGITTCCGYDFGTDGFGESKVNFCPICGKRIVKISGKYQTYTL